MLKVKRTSPPTDFYDQIDRPRDLLLHWAHRSPEERRQRRAPIDQDVFYASQIVEMVASDFAGCCAYCERAIGSSEGIGHFRPQSLPYDESSGSISDHYSWLAFEWLNLFLICRRCQKVKADQFPVLDRRARFLATFDEVLADEQPLLINPTSDNPSLHLSYLATGECFVRKNSSKGNTTVSIMELNDEYLLRDRRVAIDEALIFWRAVLGRGGNIPHDFLMSGSFRGACREVLIRTLSEYGIDGLSINNWPAVIRRLRVLVDESDNEDRVRMLKALEFVQNSDSATSAEIDQRNASSFASVYQRRPLAEQRVTVLSPKSEVVGLRISNFRAIDQLDIRFQAHRSEKSGASCLLLLGENSVGKSTCLSAIALALLGTREARKLRLTYSELARSSSRESWDVWGKQRLEVNVRFDDRSASANFYYDPVRNHVDGTVDQSTIVLGYGPHRYFANTRSRRQASSAQRVRSLFDARKPLPDPSDWLSGLRGFVFDEVARTIRTILPIGDDDNLINDRRAGICVSAQGQLTPLSHLSEGYRSIFAMVADMCRSFLDHWSNLATARGVVMIDEIETHLHPRWKMRVISSLRSAFPNVQFIVSTHDPLCVRGMDDGEVVVLTRDKSGGVQLLEDLPNISGMTVEQLLTSEYFGLSSTIDPEVQLEIARLAQGLDSDPSRAIGVEAEKLISKLTVGDSAAAQIIHEAVLRYLRERERPAGSLSSGARADAVSAVFRALRTSRAS